MDNNTTSLSVTHIAVRSMVSSNSFFVCHLTSPHLSSPAGAPDRFRKIDLECVDNSSLVVFDELQRTDMTCMLDEFMKEDSDNSPYCLRFVVCEASGVAW